MITRVNVNASRGLLRLLTFATNLTLCWMEKLCSIDSGFL